MIKLVKTKIALIGTGQRAEAFMSLLANSADVELVALCDNNPARLNDFADKHKCPDIAKYTSFDSMLNSCCFDALIIVVPDYMHAEIAIKALQHGKHILLEKPMAPTTEQCRDILRAQKGSGAVIQLGFVLREHPMYKKIKEIVASGSLGQILSISATEDISVMHGASYMRRWHRKSENSGSFILAKCSHDLDLLSWLVDSSPVRVASFGCNNFFTTAKYKHKHCSECPEKDCRFRFGGEFVYQSEQEQKTPSKFDFDLCVYNPDKDIVDNQVVIIEYANGVKANFALNLFAGEPKRTIKITAANAYLTGDSSNFKVEIIYSDGREKEEIICLEENNNSGHGGSDLLFFENFIDSISNGSKPCADYNSGLCSTVLGEAIEKSRLEKRVVEINPQDYP